MLDTHINDWAQAVINNRADKSWVPIISMNTRTADGATSTAGISITVDDDMKDGVVQIRAMIDGNSEVMAEYCLPISVKPE